MSVIATAVRHLMAAGVTGEALVQAIADLEAAMPKGDPVAEKRRAYDRERKRNAKANSTGIPPESAESAESAETPSLSPSPLPSPQTPQPTPRPHTHPENTIRAREDDPFPRPEWCEAQVWRDLKANRKAKRLPCTPTAYAKLMRDIEKLVDDDWPPGRLLEAIVARGWAAAYDPREERAPTNVHRPQFTRPSTREIGESVAAELAAGRA